MKTKRFNILLVFITATILYSCCTKKENKTISQFKEEILKTENEFQAAAKEKGIARAFYDFADVNAVIKRQNDTLIKGNENIRKYLTYVNAMKVEESDIKTITNLEAVLNIFEELNLADQIELVKKDLDKIR